LHPAPKHRRQHQEKQGKSENRDANAVAQSASTLRNLDGLFSDEALCTTNHRTIGYPPHGEKSGSEFLFLSGKERGRWIRARVEPLSV
jgi:hypothetical protein